MDSRDLSIHEVHIRISYALASGDIRSVDDAIRAIAHEISTMGYTPNMTYFMDEVTYVIASKCIETSSWDFLNAILPILYREFDSIGAPLNMASAIVSCMRGTHGHILRDNGVSIASDLGVDEQLKLYATYKIISRYEECVELAHTLNPFIISKNMYRAYPESLSVAHLIVDQLKLFDPRHVAMVQESLGKGRYSEVFPYITYAPFHQQCMWCVQNILNTRHMSEKAEPFDSDVLRIIEYAMNEDKIPLSIPSIVRNIDIAHPYIENCTESNFRDILTEASRINVNERCVNVIAGLNVSGRLHQLQSAILLCRMYRGRFIPTADELEFFMDCRSENRVNANFVEYILSRYVDIGGRLSMGVTKLIAEVSSRESVAGLMSIVKDSPAFDPDSIMRICAKGLGDDWRIATLSSVLMRRLREISPYASPDIVICDMPIIVYSIVRRDEEWCAQLLSRGANYYLDETVMGRLRDVDDEVDGWLVSMVLRHGCEETLNASI